MNDETQQPEATLTHSPEPQAAQAEAPAPNPIPAHSAAAIHGVVAKLESQLELELKKGETSFKNWIKTIAAEIKAHVKI